MAASQVPPAVVDLAASQDGVLSRMQALALGMSEHTWNWQRRTSWRTVIPGVVVTHTGIPTDRQRAWAAVLHAGRGAVLHGDAALLEQGLDLRLTHVDVGVPAPRRVVGGRLLEGPRLRTHSLPVVDRVADRAFGPPVAGIAAAVLRAADWAPDAKRGAWRLAACVQRRLVTPGQLRESLASMSLAAAEHLARVIDDVEHGAHAGSELEFLDFLRRFGLPEPDRLQVLVRTTTGKRYLDGRYDRQRVTVEIDGAHHMEVEQWDADALRSLELAVASRGRGETVIRLTMGNIRYDGERAAALLAELLHP